MTLVSEDVDKNGLLPGQFAYWGPEGRGYLDGRGDLYIVSAGEQDKNTETVLLPYGAPRNRWVRV